MMPVAWFRVHESDIVDFFFLEPVPVTETRAALESSGPSEHHDDHRIH
jgi:hypothetical protein